MAFGFSQVGTGHAVGVSNLFDHGGFMPNGVGG